MVKDPGGREWHLLQTSPKQVVCRCMAPVLSLSVEPEVARVVTAEVVAAVSPVYARHALTRPL